MPEFRHVGFSAALCIAQQTKSWTVSIHSRPWHEQSCNACIAGLSSWVVVLVKEARLETEKQVRDEAERVHTFHSPVSMRKHQFYFLHHSRLSICSGGWSECYSERGCGCFFNLWRRRPFSLIVNANTKGAEYRCHSQNWTTSCNNFKEQKPLSSPERRGTKFVGLPQGFPFPHSIIYP